MITGLLFNLFIFAVRGVSAAANFFNGYMLEFVFSFDNLFAYHVIMQHYSAPDAAKPMALFAFLPRCISVSA